MSDSDLAQVTSWLKAQGLTVDGFSRARTRVFFSGSAAQVESVFHTELHRYLVNGQMSLANATEISVPQAISGMVLGFRGLETFRPLPRARVARPNFTSHQTGNHFLAPGDFATIYNIPAALDGTGQKIAIVGQTDINFSDIDAFRTAAGLPARTTGANANFQKVLIPSGGSGFSDGDEVEANLDLEWSNAVARNATILYVYAGANSATKNVFDALLYAVDQNLAPVISTSYGNCEANLTGFLQTLQQAAQQANAQGQTITAASGDSGAADCDAATVSSATHGLAVDSPASLPEVTGIGGTEFTGDAAGAVTGTAPNTTAGATAFWGGTNSTTDNLSSALSYIPETVWNDTPASVTAGQGLSATGGGKSAVFSKPSWQTGTGVPDDASRDVPDISFSGSPNHDGYLICSQSFFAGVTPAVTSCTSGFRGSDGSSLAVVGGTSAGAPAFAGIVALLNQKTGSNGLGNVNPTLYSLAASAPNAFHDITTPGDNKVPCTQGTKGCPAAAPFQYGFSAGTGYDQVTGLGFAECDQPGERLGSPDPQPGFLAFWILRHNFNSRPVRHVSNRGGIKLRFQRDRGPHVPAGLDQCANHLHHESHLTYGRRIWRNGDDDYLHDRAPRALRRHLITRAAWPGLAGGQQQCPVCRHFLPRHALAPSSHHRAWTHAAGIFRRRRGLRWREQQRRIRADRGNAQGQLQHHGDGHQRLVVPYCQRSRDGAVGRVWVGHSCPTFLTLIFQQITWGQPPPAVRWSEAPLFSAVPHFIPMNSRAALDRTAGGGCPHVICWCVNPFPACSNNADWECCTPASTSKFKGNVKGVGQECPTHTSPRDPNTIYKSTAVVLPPQTRTPTRSPGCGR